MEQLPVNANDTTPISPEGQARFLELYSAGLAEMGVDLDRWWQERNAAITKGTTGNINAAQNPDQPVGE